MGGGGGGGGVKEETEGGGFDHTSLCMCGFPRGTGGGGTGADTV